MGIVRPQPNTLLLTAAPARTDFAIGPDVYVGMSLMALFWIFVGNQPLNPPRGRDDLGKKMPWVATTRFSILGFAPEGNVYCNYSLSGADYPSMKSVTFFAHLRCGCFERCNCVVRGPGV